MRTDGDYISRKAALDAISEWLMKALHPENMSSYSEGERAAYRTALSEIADIHAADVRPVVHGKWERHFSRPCVYSDLFWHCSVCGYKNAESFANTDHRFCPNCGADMREV